MAGLICAQEIAEHLHKGQTYGDKPYTWHLAQVCVVLREFDYGDNVPLMAAAWLHDVFEDTKGDARFLIAAGFDPYVVALVDAVTDEPGENRKIRKLATYLKMRRIPEAVILKQADRLANIRAGIEFGKSRLVDMYDKKQPEFQEHLGDMGDNRMWFAIRLELSNAEKRKR